MPTSTEFLTPVLVLVAWTLVMWIWMYATRLPAMREAGMAPQDAAYPGTWSHRLLAAQQLRESHGHGTRAELRGGPSLRGVDISVRFCGTAESVRPGTMLPGQKRARDAMLVRFEGITCWE